MAVSTVANRAFRPVWQGAVGEHGHGTRIDAGVTLVLPKRIRLGNHCYLARGTRLTTELHTGHLVIGDNAVIGPDVRIDYSGGISIGDDALISEGVHIYTHDHNTRDFKIVHSSSLTIGNHVWLASRAVILPSVRRIGHGAVVGAGSIVTRDVDAGAVVAGNPARIVGKIGE